MPPKAQQKSDAETEGSTQVANPGTSNLPAHLQKSRGRGKENIDQSDMIIPRVALMQSTHKEVEEGKTKSGRFWHTVLEEDLGPQLDDLVIIHHSKRYTLWKPRHEGGGLLARASDGRRWDPAFRGMEFEIQPDKMRPRHKVKWKIDKDGIVSRDEGLGAWGTSDPENVDSQPAATLSHVLVCVSLSRLDIGPFVVLLQRTSEKVGKALLTKINLDSVDLFGQVYAMSAKSDSGPSGDYYQYAFTKNGHVMDAEVFAKLESLYERFEAQGVKYDDSKDAGDGETTTNGASSGGLSDEERAAGGRAKY